VLAATALCEFGNELLCKEVLPEIASGRTRFGVGLAESYAVRDGAGVQLERARAAAEQVEDEGEPAGREHARRPLEQRRRCDGAEAQLGDPARAVEILGAVVNDGVAQRIDAARALGPIVVDSQAIVHPQFKDARIRTPLIVKLDAKDEATYLKEWFGPIAFVIATEGTGQSLDIARRAVREHGALTLSVYSKSPAVIDEAVAVAEDAGVALSINLTGGVFVNQSAAFSDYHGTGANPAANAALTDAAFVASRFRVVQHRMHV